MVDKYLITSIDDREDVDTWADISRERGVQLVAAGAMVAGSLLCSAAGCRPLHDAAVTRN